MFAKNIKVFALIVVVVTVIFSMVYQFTAVPAILSLAITFGTISYHFVMRLAVGYLINGIFHNKMDYRRKWFQERSFGLYSKTFCAGCFKAEGETYY